MTTSASSSALSNGSNNSNNSNGANNAIAVKVVGPPCPNGQDTPVTRRFTLSLDPTPRWSDVESQITSLHNISLPFTVTYLDEDNEEIRIDRDSELLDLIASAQRRNLASIRLTVKNVGNISTISEDPRRSDSSVATFRTQASQNLSSAFLPPPPSAAALNAEGWKVTQSRPGSQQFENRSSLNDDTNNGHYISQPIDQHQLMAGGGQYPAHPHSPQHHHPHLPSHQHYSPYGYASQASTMGNGMNSHLLDAAALEEREKQMRLEAELFSLLAHQQRVVEEQQRGTASGSGISIGDVTAALKDTKLNSSQDDVSKFLEQVKSVVGRHPDYTGQFLRVIEQ
ncbi:hypothetical protein HDU76_009405, partial [Blyttiomyces sp. JEL0837]